MWNFFHFVSIWRPCLESAHQLLHLLHLEKIVLILFPRYRQNLHRFYKVKISPFLVVCLLDIYLTTFCLGGGWGGFAWQGSWRRRRHSGQTIPPQMQKKVTTLLWSYSTFQVNKLTLEKVTRQRQRLEVSETIRSDILRYYFPEKLENKAHMIYKCLSWVFIHAAIGTQVSCFTTTWARNL